MARGKAYRRWKTMSKYIARIRKRLSWMQIDYGEVEVEFNGVKRIKKFWKHPKDWKEADANNDTTAAKSLKDTPTPYTEPWKKVQDKTTIKKMREDSRRIIDDELNNET